jgi:hypothetical protein
MMKFKGSRFVTYDPLLNNISFSGKLSDYVPNVPVNTIGVTHDGNLTLLLMTTENQLKVRRHLDFEITIWTSK